MTHGRTARDSSTATSGAMSLGAVASSDDEQIGSDVMRDPRYVEEAEEVLARYFPILEPMWQAMGPRTELVVHNYAKLPHSIVAVYGNVTGREVGGPATNLGLRNLARSTPENRRIGYTTTTPDGRLIKSSSIYLFGSFTPPVGAVCINTDITALSGIVRLAHELGGGYIESQDTRESTSVGNEAFYMTVDQAADDILKEAIRASGVSVEMMSKKQKVEIVRELDERGYFLLKQAVDTAASALGVTRYTIYSYINQISSHAIK